MRIHIGNRIAATPEEREREVTLIIVNNDSHFVGVSMETPNSPAAEYLSVAIFSHPARSHPARMTGHYLHANATLLYDFFCCLESRPRRHRMV